MHVVSVGDVVLCHLTRAYSVHPNIIIRMNQRTLIKCQVLSCNRKSSISESSDLVAQTSQGQTDILLNHE